MSAPTETVHLTAEAVTDENFRPFGVVLHALEDGTPFTDEEAALDVSEGTPRFYLMTLRDKPLQFTRITRHLHTTQTLMAAGGAEWFIAVAPARGLSEGEVPLVDDIKAFAIPGDVAITMAKGTWHSGPYFAAEELAFVNLELSDTNIVDHHSYQLDRELGIRIVIDPA
ncbi:ureidoglycolate lyase [Herbiconiux ginsengi]|uniref:Ureidoglycolate hydrolase (Allantoin degradation) n=1 Tax=Herbiconiux ginsengi TaxID=381665 RepID=A0A1H3S1D7_9MICO|nr:ureidoglycolate lyase [Herbiconiux ginsengi]SDZ31365.1 Ureidoglycolate hydrolase (allantoin degradation) [Herbiconiux ginsengi]